MKKRPQNSKVDIFIDSLKEVYPTNYSEILNGLFGEKPTTFRINTLKGDIKKTLEELKEIGFTVKKGPFENSFILVNVFSPISLSRTEPYAQGKIYIQELASMIPPLVFNFENVKLENLKILDMSAAPGSKTTQLAALTENKSEILAIDKHPIRIKTLEFNIKTLGATSATALLNDGIKFDKRNPQFTEYFDKVLVDAPCSSEGRFNLDDKKSYAFWNIKKRNEMSRTQKGLLISGYRMLKPGGELVYSTCTFGLEENELVLQWFLEKYPEAEMSPFALPITNTKMGRLNWGDKILNGKIKNAKRIIPTQTFGGFFVAKLRKPLQ